MAKEREKPSFEEKMAGLIPVDRLPLFTAHSIDSKSLEALIDEIRGVHPGTDIEPVEVDGMICELATRVEADGRKVLSLIEPAGHNGEVEVTSLFTRNGITYGEHHLDIQGPDEPQQLTTSHEYHVLAVAIDYKYGHLGADEQVAA